MTSVGWYLVLLWRGRRRPADRDARVAAPPARDGASAGALERRAGLRLAWWRCTPACSRRAAIEVVSLHRPFVPAVGWPALVALVLANLLRWWVIATLGPHWNVRVMGSLSLGVVSAGPFRYVRHPNYVAVFVELAALPLVHGAWLTALWRARSCIVLVLAAAVALEESVLLADARLPRRSWADKPRFVPRAQDALATAPTAPKPARISADVGAVDVLSRAPARPARRWRCCWVAPDCASRSTTRDASRARSPAARGSCRPAWPCCDGWDCARRSAGAPLQACATTASASRAESRLPRRSTARRRWRWPSGACTWIARWSRRRAPRPA